MQCQDLARDEHLEEYLNGQLGPATQDELEVHILECPSCLQALEILQTVRDDLARRAGEIRLHQSARRVWVRWQFVAGFTVVLAVGSVVLRQTWQRYFRSTPPPPVAASTAKPPTHTEVANAGGPGQGLPSPEKRLSETVSGTSATSHSPHRETSHSPAQRESNKTGTSSSPSRAPGETVLPAKNETDQTTTGTPPPAGGTPEPKAGSAPDEVAATRSQPPGKTPPAETLSHEVEAELFRLGTVQAPPYTFSGLAGATRPSEGKNHDRSSTSSGLTPEISVGKPGQSPASPRAVFQSAMIAYVERRYKDASVLLEEAVAAEPKASDANFFLGVCRLLTGKPKEAVEPLKTVLDQGNSAFSQRAHYYLAKAYLQTRNLIEAETQLKAASTIPGGLRSVASSDLARLRAVNTKLEAPTELEKPPKPE